MPALDLLPKPRVGVVFCGAIPAAKALPGNAKGPEQHKLRAFCVHETAACQAGVGSGWTMRKLLVMAAAWRSMALAEQ